MIESSRSWVALRATVGLAVLLGEGLLLGLCFDAAALALLPGGWWSVVLGRAGWAMPIAAAVFTAALLVGGPRAHQRMRELAGRGGCGVTSGAGWLVLHLAAFAGFFLISGVLFRNVPVAARSPGPWVIGWGVLAAGTLVSWSLWMIPGRVLWPLGRELSGVAAAALAIGLVAWAAGQYTQTWWGVLRRPTLNSALAVLRVFDPGAWAEPRRFLIGSGDFAAKIAPHCSGAEGIGLITVFLAAYFWFFRYDFRLRRVIVLVPLAWLLAWSANVLRIAALVAVGGNVSASLAAGGFHSYAGALLFSAVALGVAAVAWTRPFRREARDEPDDRPMVNPATPFLAPFLASVAAGLVIGLLSTEPQPLHLAAQGVLVLAVLAFYRKAYFGAELRGGGWVVAAGAGIVVAALWVLLMRPGRGEQPQPPPGWPWSWVVLRSVQYIVLAPLVEELAFRGFLARRIVSAEFDRVAYRELSWPALALSGIAFGLLHQQILPGIVAGCAFGWVVRRTGRLSDAVLAHAIANAVVTVYVVATGRWWLWS